MKHQPKHIMVGLSGGVDSSVTLLLLKEQGFQVSALFMKNWEEDDEKEYCPATQDLEDAQSVCDKLGVTLHTVNFAREYWESVFRYFLSEYQSGRTPNPDILCNREIKFKAFLDYALYLGADTIATGHYARKKHTPDGFLLCKAKDLTKDQSYFLYALSQYPLSHALFPLGDLTKIEVRVIAKKAGFRNFEKKDSTGICFIGERKFKDFLSRYLPMKPGNIETPDGKILGQHQGTFYYTIGQRHGLGVGGKANSEPEPWYVVNKNVHTNVLTIVQGENHPLLFHDSLKAIQLHWILGKPPAQEFICTAKIRYRQIDQNCHVVLNDPESCTVTFDIPQRAIAPGQSIVFYQGDICLGGGIIAAFDNEK